VEHDSRKEGHQQEESGRFFLLNAFRPAEALGSWSPPIGLP
jgi:hypothetical protein